MRDPRERLRDILEAISAIERYLNRGRAAFEQDELWHKIIGMRNVLVHGYFDVDLDVVWDAASRDAPALRPHMERLLQRLEELGYGG